MGTREPDLKKTSKCNNSVTLEAKMADHLWLLIFSHLPETVSLVVIHGTTTIANI
jgi:hypothetical protein